MGKIMENEKRLALKVLETYKSDIPKNEFKEALEKVNNNDLNTIKKLKDSIFLEDGFKIELGQKFHKENKYPEKIPNISADGVNGALNKALSKEYGIKLNKEELIGVHNEVKSQKKGLGLSR